MQSDEPSTDLPLTRDRGASRRTTNDERRTTGNAIHGTRTHSRQVDLRMERQLYPEGTPSPFQMSEQTQRIAFPQRRKLLADLPNVQDEPRPWPARLVLLGARGV